MYVRFDKHGRDDMIGGATSHNKSNNIKPHSSVKNGVAKPVSTVFKRTYTLCDPVPITSQNKLGHKNCTLIHETTTCDLHNCVQRECNKDNCVGQTIDRNTFQNNIISQRSNEYNSFLKSNNISPNINVVLSANDVKHQFQLNSQQTSITGLNTNHSSVRGSPIISGPTSSQLQLEKQKSASCSCGNLAKMDDGSWIGSCYKGNDCCTAAEIKKTMAYLNDTDINNIVNKCKNVSQNLSNTNPNANTVPIGPVQQGMSKINYPPFGTNGCCQVIDQNLQNPRVCNMEEVKKCDASCDRNISGRNALIQNYIYDKRKKYLQCDSAELITKLTVSSQKK